MDRLSELNPGLFGNDDLFLGLDSLPSGSFVNVVLSAVRRPEVGEVEQLGIFVERESSMQSRDDWA